MKKKARFFYKLSLFYVKFGFLLLFIALGSKLKNAIFGEVSLKFSDIYIFLALVLINLFFYALFKGLLKLTENNESK